MAGIETRNRSETLPLKRGRRTWMKAVGIDSNFVELESSGMGAPTINEDDFPSLNASPEDTQDWPDALLRGLNLTEEKPQPLPKQNVVFSA